MERLYTIGEISEITKIEKRILKYFVEQELIIPNSKKVEGGKSYWLYSDADIINIKQIALYRELGYSTNDIKKIIKAPDYDWEKALDDQIEALKSKKRHLENMILAAEVMRYINDDEEEHVLLDISDFDNDIDQFAVDTFSYDEDEVTEYSLEKIQEKYISELTSVDLYKEAKEVVEQLSSIKNAMTNDPASSETKETIQSFFEYLAPLKKDETIPLQDILFIFRLVSNLSMERIIDMLFATEGATGYLENALQDYIHIKEVKEVKKDDE